MHATLPGVPATTAASCQSNDFEPLLFVSVPALCLKRSQTCQAAHGEQHERNKSLSDSAGQLTWKRQNKCCWLSSDWLTCQTQLKVRANSSVQTCWVNQHLHLICMILPQTLTIRTRKGASGAKQTYRCQIQHGVESILGRLSCFFNGLD